MLAEKGGRQMVMLIVLHESSLNEVEKRSDENLRVAEE